MKENKLYFSRKCFSLYILNTKLFALKSDLEGGKFFEKGKKTDLKAERHDFSLLYLCSGDIIDKK